MRIVEVNCWHCDAKLILNPPQQPVVIECPCCGAAVPLEAMAPDSDEKLPA